MLRRPQWAHTAHLSVVNGQGFSISLHNNQSFHLQHWHEVCHECTLNIISSLHT